MLNFNESRPTRTRSESGYWTSVRVSRSTKERLERLREEFRERETPGSRNALGSIDIRSGRRSKKDEIGLDQVIRKLIALLDEHRQRSKASGKSNTK